MGLALWLVPTNPSFVSTLQTEAAALRSANAGKCSGEFGIHATLLAGLGDRGITVEGLRGCLEEAIRVWKAKQREGEGGSLTVGLKDVTSRGKYFQCILISLETTESLLDLNSITSRIVNSHFPPIPSSTAEQYFPHISLLYSSISQPSAQSQIHQMQQHKIFTPNKQGISFRGFSDVEFDRVEVWDCTGKPEDWTKKASVPL
ncbi:hypothetical protein PHBOTO_002369 [Pseudozyma hubeiensis]|nr:hypothetical protein PHBOTO_002369 [Pseudozyma hubeiensis]